jgi:hypothetical protein
MSGDRKTAPNDIQALTVETQLSLAHIIGNGLVFFTALMIRDYLTENVTLLPKSHQRFRRFLNLCITLVVVACLLVAVNYWKRKVEENKE